MRLCKVLLPEWILCPSFNEICLLVTGKVVPSPPTVMLIVSELDGSLPTPVNDGEGVLEHECLEIREITPFYV